MIINDVVLIRKDPDTVLVVYYTPDGEFMLTMQKGGGYLSDDIYDLMTEVSASNEQLCDDIYAALVDEEESELHLIIKDHGDDRDLQSTLHLIDEDGEFDPTLLELKYGKSALSI